MKLVTFLVVLAAVAVYKSDCWYHCQTNICQLQKTLLTRIGQLERNLLSAIQRNPQRPVQVRPSSCADIRRRNPNSQSGFYTLVTRYGNRQRVFCFMGSLPGCGDGGWRRIASFDRRAGQTCPRGFVDFHKHGRIACSHSGTGCQSVTFPAGQSYTRVCGRVQGYGIATPDAFFRYGKGNINDINSAYLDGVSITYGHP